MEAALFTERLCELAEQRWGDVTKTLTTNTWDDGTYTIHVFHTIANREEHTSQVEARLTYRSGSPNTRGHSLYETVSGGVSYPKEVLYYEGLDDLLTDNDVIRI